MNKILSILSIVALAGMGAFLANCGKPQPKPAASADISTLPVFLRYPGARAIERIALTTQDNKGVIWTLVTPDPRPKVTEWYQASVEKQGWNNSPKTDASPSSMFEWQNPDRTETVRILLYEKDGKTHISLTQAEK